MKNGIASILVEFVQTWGIATLNTSHLMGYINNIYIYIYVYMCIYIYYIYQHQTSISYSTMMHLPQQMPRFLVTVG